MKIRLFVAAVLLAATRLYGQTEGDCVTTSILSSYSERKYTTEPVSDQQIDIILKCGIKAPSSKNGQPWKFTVVKEESAMKEIIKDVISGNVLIIVSGMESPDASTPAFDCGLATESMFVAAHSLGLGARIYGGPVGNVNSKKEAFQIPAGYKAVVILRVGNTDKSVDAVSAATPRKTVEEVVNFYK
jgi:nitroreductase